MGCFICMLGPEFRYSERAEQKVLLTTKASFQHHSHPPLFFFKSSHLALTDSELCVPVGDFELESPVSTYGVLELQAFPLFPVLGVKQGLCV